MQAGSIGPVMDGVHQALDSWLGSPRREQKEGNVALTYRVRSELAPVVPLRLKIEINTREHFTVLGLVEQTLAVESRWFSGRSSIPTFALDELLGTKLRALYQRRKGRDLFDLWLGLKQRGADAATVVDVFSKYVEAEGNAISRAEFEHNLTQKMKHAGFLSDVPPLLRPGIAYDAVEAHRLVEEKLLARLGAERRTQP
jgi:predicted nucleotidyltransferase component of viral defense system